VAAWFKLIRLVAWIVLITSAFDYVAFDLSDPAAPMSSAGREVAVGIVPPQLSPVQARTTDLPDDRCLGCSPSIAPKSPIVRTSDLISFVVENKTASLPSSEPASIERPPRA
jgi:hypothetical protein